MGLDMFAMVTAERPARPVDFTVSDSRLIFEWHKHPNLHGWMRALYRAKGCMAETFNRGAPVVLTDADLDRLEADVRANRLPYTTQGLLPLCLFRPVAGEETGSQRCAGPQA